MADELQVGNTCTAGRRGWRSLSCSPGTPAASASPGPSSELAGPAPIPARTSGDSDARADVWDLALWEGSPSQPWLSSDLRTSWERKWDGQGRGCPSHKCPGSVWQTAMGHRGSDHVGVREMGISRCMEHEVGRQRDWGGGCVFRPAVCLVGCVRLGKWHNLSELHSHLGV